MATAREISELLEERPDLEPAIVAVLAVEPPWDFHDVDVDSGAFGELVAHGVVEQTADGYHVPDRAAVERALAGDVQPDPADSRLAWPELSVSVTRLELALLLGALALVVGFRLFPWPTVFREGHVVLSGNDPYYYRYWVELTLSSAEVQLSSLPGGVTNGEPLLVATLWLVSLVFGGAMAAGHVLVWYPVVTAVLTAVLVYATASLVTDDRRIGLAAVALLAVLPGHAFRTSLGFADHHPFDYLWLAVTLFGVVLVASEASRQRPVVSPRTIAGAATVAVGVTGQALAWDNSPIIIAVLAPYLALESIRAVHADESPGRTLGPVLAGIALATVLVWTAHDRLGWHTELVAVAPLLVLVGGVGVVLAGELFHRLEWPAVGLAGAEAAVAVVLPLVLRSLRPELWTRLTSSVEGRLLADRAIAEVQSIFSDSFGWLLLFGFILVLAVPYLGWASRRAVDDARWLAPVTYAWYFFVLSTIQARFVGELSPVLAIFAGLGLVHLAERIDVARRPAPFTDGDPPDLRLPDRRQAGYLAVLFLLVAGLSIVQVPIVTSKVTTPAGLSDTAFYLEADSADRGLEYPQNYVFSQWGKNRAYNYFVNGEARSYGYAQSNYVDFITSTDPEGWYDRLSGRTGYVVTTPVSALEPTQVGAILHRDNGSRTAAHPGVAHYRLIYVADGGGYKAFELVEGAVLRGQAEPNATLTARTEVDVPGASFAYGRETTADTSGNYSLRVAHPGTYQVAGGTVTVTEAAVRNGSVIDGVETSD